MASAGDQGAARWRIPAGLDAYNRNGLIHQHATRSEARAGIVAEWKAIERGGVDRDGVECGIETMTNAERVELNALARQAQNKLGWLSGLEVTLETPGGPTPYRAGDRVIVRDDPPSAWGRGGSMASKWLWLPDCGSRGRLLARDLDR